ncbi:hypothetical protein ACLQ2E_17870 [Streptomyces lavendulocolor]
MASKRHDDATEQTAATEDTSTEVTEAPEDRSKDDGHTGPRPRVEWTDDGGPRPEGVEAKVNDPRPTETSDAHDGAARADGPDSSK